MKIKALAPWFGSNRSLASEVGKAMCGCSWVGIPFAGGMSEVPYIEARTIAVNDKHEHIINLARVVSDPVLGPKLYRRLRRVPFHPWPLEVAQRACATYNPPKGNPEAWLNFATDYFICCWMGRSAKAGTDNEFSGGLPVRWTSSGGDSNTRYRSAVASLQDWRKALVRCNFTTLDFSEFLESVIDQEGHGVYSDAPFPDAGDDYLHKFDEAKQRYLAELLMRFRIARVVVRFYDHPLIRELYPMADWDWQFLEGGKTQANTKAPEVLLTKRN